MPSIRPHAIADTGLDRAPRSRAPGRAEPATELSQLGRAARLLEDAQRSLERAGDEADKRNREVSGRIHDLEENLSEMEQLLVRTERQAAQLANLYVATYQLHASLDVADVRAAIADIAVNLLGAERFSILFKDESGRLLAVPEPTFDAPAEPNSAQQEPEPPTPYDGGDAVIDASLKDCCPQFGPREGSEVLASVPFVRQGEVVGLLLVRGFLRHKPGLTADDYELLDLMAAHAASALVAARAFHVSQRKLTAYEGLLGFLRGGPS